MEFGIELLKKDSLARGRRRGKKELPHSLVSKQELSEVYDEITLAVYDVALQNGWLGQIEKLLKEYRHLGANVLWKMAEKFDKTQFSSSTLQPMHYWLRTELYNSKKYGWTDWTEVFESWVQHTESNDPVRKFNWMFSEWFQLPAEELLNDDEWEKRTEHSEKLRAAKLAELKTESGIEAVLPLLETMDDQYKWGVFLAKNTAKEEFAILTEAIRSHKKLYLLAGFFDFGDFQAVADVFEKIPEAEKLQLLSLLKREEIGQWLTTEERKQAYWKNQSMTIYSEQKYRNLLQYHPGGLLLYLYDQCSQIERLFDQFKEVFETIAEQELVPQDTGYLSEVVDNVDEHFYSDEWARCCLLLYKKERLPNFPQCLQRYFFDYPKEMITLLNESASFKNYAYYYYTLPKKAFQDKESFNRWCECLNRESANILGRILGRGCNGDDGLFPHEFVREFLEVQQNEMLIRNVVYGKISSRGARIIQDGRENYEQAKRYQTQAQQLELTFPQSASILRKLAKFLEAESQYDRIEAEIVP